MSNRLLRLVVRRVADGDEGEELLAVTAEAVRNGGRRDAIAELAGLIGLALRLRCRRATDDRPVAIWRQGLWIGALLLAVLALVELGSGVVAEPEPGPAMAFVMASVAFVALVVWQPILVAAFAPAALASMVLVTVSQPGAGSDLVRLAVLSVAALLGAPIRPPRRARAALVWSAPIVVAIASSGVVGVGAVLDASTVVVVGVVGAAFLGAGWFDPRLAVAVTIVWAWRFLAVDPPLVGDALMALAGDLDLQALLVRWIGMAVGVICGLAVSRVAVRRAAAL